MPIFNGGRIGSNNVPFTGTKSNDPNYSSVSLLLNGNGTSGSDPNYSSVSLLLNGNDLTDSSSHNHTLSNTNITVDTTTKKYGSGSLEFSTSAYGTFPHDTSFDIGTGDFTIEAWVYPQNSGTRGIAHNHPSFTGGGFTFWVSTNSLLVIQLFTNGSSSGDNLISTTTVPNGTWAHVAYSRSGGTGYLFVNGNLEGTNTDSRNLTNNSAFYIGVAEGSSYKGIGYIDDLRFTVGVGRYTSSFTPPKAQLPDFGNTITDSSSYSHTVTPVGNAQISTAQSKFGGASMYFDGSGDYLTLTNDASFVFGTGDFTVEMWVYHTSEDSQKIYYDGRPSATTGAYVALYKTPENKLALFVNGANRIVGTTSILQNAWYHIAVCRQGSSTKLFLNGIQEGSTFTDTTNYLNGTSRPIIGADGFNPSANTQMQGYIDDLRVTKGVARYTDNFTPPTAQLPGGETGTFASGLWTGLEQCDAIRREIWPGLVPPIVTDGLVLHLDAGDSNSYPGSGTTWFDLTTNSNDGTISGATYGSADGGSLSFDGNDYVSSFSSQIYGTGSKTVTVWFKVATTSRAGLCGTRPNDGTQKGWVLTVNQTQGDLTYFHTGVAGITVSNVISTNVWYCATATYDSSSTLAALYLNGSQLASQSSFDSSNSSNFNGIIGNEANVGGADSRPFVGDIAQVSIYNRVLTQSEITQNYNALKGRYGL